MNIRSFPIVQEAELRQLVAAGAEVEIACLREADRTKRSRGEWLLMVHGPDHEPLVLVSSLSKHRIFYRFEGICAYCAHTLDLGEVRVPVVEGGTARGMYHRSHRPGAS